MRGNLFHTFLLCSAAGLVLAACNKDVNAPLERQESVGAPQEIVLGCRDGLDLEVDSKASATEITSLPGSLYWGATTGTSTEAAKWSSTSKTVSSSKIATGKYQTATPTAYNYYVSNVNMSIGANTTISAANTTDVICGRTAASTSTTPSVTLNHIFARTGTVTATAPSGFSASNVSWTIVSKGSLTGTAGTYNLRTGAWSSVTALASSTLTSSATTSSTSDYYLIPGEYTITVSYTLTKGDNVQSYTKSGDVTLVAGKKNNISCTLISNTVSEIQISCTLTAWGTQDVNLTLS